MKNSTSAYIDFSRDRFKVFFLGKGGSGSQRFKTFVNLLMWDVTNNDIPN